MLQGRAATEKRKKPPDAASLTPMPPQQTAPEKGTPDDPLVITRTMIAMAVAVGLVAHGFAWARFDSTHGFSEMKSDLQREMIFTTESGDVPATHTTPHPCAAHRCLVAAFYYSYFRDVHEAPSLAAAFKAFQLGHGSGSG
jgi:hypothetical protein